MNASLQHCYRHPKRETNVSCSNCGRPICPDCMTPSPVGMRCPECAGERQQVYTRADIAANSTGIAAAWRRYPVTTALISINVVVFLLQIATGFPLAFSIGGGGGWVTTHAWLSSPQVAQGDWWRIVTTGFIHLGVIHVALNMLLLYVIGRDFEPDLGGGQLLAVYLASLIAGSFGAILLEPHTASAGASGAVFGLMGMALVAARSRRHTEMFQSIAILVGINLVMTFGSSGIAKGAHLGGLIGGALCGLIIFELGERRGWLGRGPRHWIGTVAALSLAGILFVACILLARHQYPQMV